MRRFELRSLAWLVALLVPSGPSASLAAPEDGPPVEEWQIKGILSALQDGHVGVRLRAAKKLAELLGAGEIDQGLKREWKGNSRQLASGASSDLVELLHDNDRHARKYAAAALGGLGDMSAAPQLIKLLDDEETFVRASAAEALGRLGDRGAVPKLLRLLHDPRMYDTERAVWALGVLGDQRSIPELLRLLDTTPYIRPYAAEALGRLGSAEVIDRLLVRVNDQDANIRQSAAESLGRLGNKAAVPELSKLLKDTDFAVRRCAAESLGLLGDQSAAPQLLKLLRDNDGILRGTAAEALGRLEATEALPELTGLLADPDNSVRKLAAKALGSLGDQRAVPELDTLLRDPDGWVRFAAAEALAQLGHAGAENSLRELLHQEDLYLRLSAAETLGRIGAKVTVADPLQLTGAGTEIIVDPRHSVHSRALSAVEQLRPTSIITLLRHPYEHSAATDDARWLAHYWGGGSQEARILCAYLGRPAVDPQLPQTREAALGDLQALAKAWQESEGWDESDRRWLREDTASWVSLIIAERAMDWRADDLPTLKEFLVRFTSAETVRVRTHAAAIERVVMPFEIRPPPWVRTLLAAASVNVVAILLMVLRPGRSDFEKWLPFLGFAGTGLGSWMANFTTALYLDAWLLGGLLIGELVMLIGAGVVSIPILRQLARIEPLNRIAVPLALRLPWSRRRFFREHVSAVRNQLARDQRQANEELYLPLAADVGSHADPTAAASEQPAGHILQFLAGTRGHVQIEAPGGRGKSALLREVVRQALDQFERHPGDAPLPVMLAGRGENIGAMAETALAGVLLTPESLDLHLQAGDFFLVLDGISESGLSDTAVSSFVQGPYGGSVPLLVSSRPVRAYRHAIEGSARWLVVEPRRLDEESLEKFVKHYGRSLPGEARQACRGPDGTYLPILVRMAMTIRHADNGVSVADVYRGYFLRLFEAQFPDEGERMQWLGKAARWCLETYWRDGLRTRGYDADDVQQRLMTAGVLIPADDLRPPAEAHFFHDSMQSYLTAHSLALQDREGYQQLPRPDDDRIEGPWDRGRALLWAAANEKFSKAQADILQTGGTELFQMCLATFAPRAGLRRWLRDELKRWAADHDENLRRKDVLAAISPAVIDQLQGTRGAARLLMAAADASYEADEKGNSVESLGHLYAGMAPFVYEIREGERLDSKE